MEAFKDVNAKIKDLEQEVEYRDNNLAAQKYEFEKKIEVYESDLTALKHKLALAENKITVYES